MHPMRMSNWMTAATRRALQRPCSRIPPSRIYQSFLPILSAPHTGLITLRIASHLRPKTMTDIRMLRRVRCQPKNIWALRFPPLGLLNSVFHNRLALPLFCTPPRVLAILTWCQFRRPQLAHSTGHQFDLSTLRKSINPLSQPIMVPVMLGMFDRRQPKARSRPCSPACSTSAITSLPVPTVFRDTRRLLGILLPNMSVLAVIARTVATVTCCGITRASKNVRRLMKRFWLLVEA